MKVSQLLHVMDRDDDILIQDESLPIDQMTLYEGTVRGIYKDNPVNAMHVTCVQAIGDLIAVLVSNNKKERNKP